MIFALVLLILLVTLSVMIGSKAIPLSVIWEAVFNPSDDIDQFSIRDYRLPRTGVGLCVGVALGTAGALIQALTRNPLADPGILGVNAGASFFVAIGVTVFGVTSIQGYVWFAFFGALIVTVAVYVIGSAGRGGVDPVQLTLAGVAVGAVLGGIVTAMALLDPQAFDQMRNWNAGSVVGRGWNVLLPVLPFLVLGVFFAVIAVPALNSIALGDDLARSLGANIIRTRILVILAVTLLAGGATAIAGPIGFVGLMVPHIARWIVGPDQRWIVAYTILLAPCLVLAADIVGRVVIRPGEFPVGIVTAFVGAPVLIVLVRRKKASGL
ncbi:iron chelate uptake ABC transporter family permease subunit [Brevibacterium aurantiacum]|nr:iron chelate uptake ABC transporter family permease subunit [Brevibacterium aurantiacum]